MATLEEIVARIDEFDEDEDVICAKPDWSPSSEARVFKLTADNGVPSEAKSLGFEYFLEISVALDVLREFAKRPKATSREKCDRLIHYAKFDA